MEDGGDPNTASATNPKNIFFSVGMVPGIGLRATVGSSNFEDSSDNLIAALTEDKEPSLNSDIMDSKSDEYTVVKTDLDKSL
jgi:hypothetical protein